ncbi:MAG: lysine--tRNA ligase, partial [Pseudomonadota bacterium]|nr:lysine--tRNA ligase [Pseudomonadota bacterium]
MTDTHIPADSNEIFEERRQKLQKLRETGWSYPNHFRRSHVALELHVAHDEKKPEELETTRIHVAIAGRMMLKRVMGKACFATLQDMSGRIQIYVTADTIGQAELDRFKQYDLGDIIGVKGFLFKTRTNELTIRAEHLILLTKSLRPLPEKFHGLTDLEQKYRQRYLDLITNEAARKVFSTRSRIIQSLRTFLTKRSFVEVETPMMHPIPGGAAARPFITHHNALEMDLFLRIAPELYLKRLVIGGMEKVFEINRNFRNEGLSTRHNPEFTMLEFYEAYSDYHDLMNLTELMLRNVTQEVTGSLKISYQGHLVDLEAPFQKFTLCEAIAHYHPSHTFENLGNRHYLEEQLNRLNITFSSTDGLEKLQVLLFEETTEHLLFNPTFIINHPAEISPLARRNDNNPDITDRFELYIAGRELANGFSELNDAEDQAARFAEQARQKEAGDQEAMIYDADYIRALEFGLPPTAGEGIGIDRLVMLLTDS